MATRKLNKYRDKILKMEFAQYPNLHYKVTLEYKGYKLTGDIYNMQHVNMYNSSDPLKRVKGFYAIGYTILKQTDNQLKIDI